MMASWSNEKSEENYLSDNLTAASIVDMTTQIHRKDFQGCDCVNFLSL